MGKAKSRGILMMFGGRLGTGMRLSIPGGGGVYTVSKYG